MVTAVKYRKALLSEKIEACIKKTLKGISERYEIEIDEVVLTKIIYTYSAVPCQVCHRQK